MSLQAYRPEFEIGEKAERLSYSLLLGPRNRIVIVQDIPFGARYFIQGVALVEIDSKDAIGVLVNNSSLVDQGERILVTEMNSDNIVRRVLEFVVDGNTSDLRDVYAIGISEPELHLASGDVLQCSSNKGICGEPVTWGNQRQGILTAGHVAQILGRRVTDLTGNIVGTVALSLIPTSGKTGADVSVVELTSNISVNKNCNGTAILSGTTNIDIPSIKKFNNPVRGKLGWFYSSSHGTYIDVYMIDHVTHKGDSGSSATLKISGTKQLVGHVVGAVPGQYSLVQDINYLLNAIKSQSGFQNISL